MKLMKRGRGKSEALAPVSGVWPQPWPWGPLDNDLNRLFERPFGEWLTPVRGFAEAWGPVADVYEDKDNIFVKVELPGIKRDEIEIYVSGEMLNIAGERKEERERKEATSYRTERYFGHFRRSIALPTAVNAKKIEAHYKDGVLTVTCPKAEEAKRKEVEIKVD
jgi:HSP20 family protein